MLPSRDPAVARMRVQRARPVAAPRNVRILLFCFVIIALAAAVLPPVFPATVGAARVPMWCALVIVAAGLGLRITVRPAAPRPVVLGVGWVLVIATVLQGFLVGDMVAMFATWLVVPAVAMMAGRLEPRPRKALVAAHVVASSCWVGTALVMTAMALVAMTADDIETSRVIYELMEVFDTTLLPWTNFATVLTGLALGITTNWGLIRYYWVAIKLAIAVGILFVAFGFLHDALERAAEQAAHLAEIGGTPKELTAAADVSLWGFGGALLCLIGAVLLSLYKPGGRTPRGRRLLPSRRTQQRIRATVAETHIVAEDTVVLDLRPTDGPTLPGWEPGAHIDLVLPSGLVRQYSLCGNPADPTSYRIAVRKEPEGRGGSREAHGLRAGANVEIRGPRSHFPLVDARAYLFVAGGIGITPLLPMIDRVHRSGAQWRLVYRGRSLSRMAFGADLIRRYPHHVTLLPADTHPRPDLETLLREAPGDVAVFCCGPEELLTAMETAAARFPDVRLHTERFAANARVIDAVNTPFDAELRRSGVVVHVPTDRTLLSVIRDVNPAVDLSCENGVCGSCATRLLAGIPDHRDAVLQSGDRADIIYPCVSRAHSQRIVLDL